MPPRDATLTRLELLQGTLDFIILQTLRWGPRHGYGLAQMIRANSQNMLQVETGSLYPALHRLTRRKLVTSQWSTSENGQRVRIYTLTPAGEKQLAAERTKWQRLSYALAGLMLEPQTGSET
jgi:PadR family transcriptional regulator PadR